MSDEPSSQIEPPGYPFPDEEIIFSSARNAPDFELGEDSWFALSRLSEDRVDIFDGREHTNGFRFTVHTPLRGSTSMFVNEADMESLICLCLAGIADGDRYGDSCRAQISESFFNHMTAEEYDISFVE